MYPLVVMLSILEYISVSGVQTRLRFKGKFVKLQASIHVVKGKLKMSFAAVPFHLPSRPGSHHGFNFISSMNHKCPGEGHGQLVISHDV